MYCPTCGTQLVQAVSYCNHCGANLPTVKNRDPDGTSVDTVMWVIVGTTITILGMGLGALVLMNDGRIDAGLGRIFVILSFLALVVVEGVLVWRLLSLNKQTKERDLPRPQDSHQAGINAARTHALGDPGEPVPIVTEQTTRNLDPLYRKPNNNKDHGRLQ